MVVAIIIASLVLILCLLSYLAANVFANIVVHPDVHSYEQSREAVLNHHCPIDPLTTLENHKVEEFRYRSEFGYELYGRIIRANDDVTFPDGRRRVVILCHGWTSNHITMLTYGKLYQELGFDIVAYDHRYHGNSERNTYCTMGLLESRDLIGLASYVKQFFPEDAIWGVQGESMGSATAMQAAPEMKWLSFIVEDCGFSSMRRQMAATLDNK
ncbi:MAG: alpha/beta fold hydrolase, partial [Spirochaetales bacterium]|nr:alpha/beta fold hydrolase [Spirochaetales bacterium]